ncbi:hypothetical protein SAY87_008349 [Trapa incisa]|uniref:RNA helicase n=1 Tax=Trapa incisa TaxID=236973 RepID=A0AAN7KI17_9MYRT|nr:hypothetical protein SAY87_008349 [Trapa incisa]
MKNCGDDDDDEVYSVVGDKGEIGYIDIENDPAVCNYDPSEEGPVVVSIPFPFVEGKPRSVLTGEISTCSITVTNTTDEPVEIWGISIYCSNPADSFTLSIMEPPTPHSDARYKRAFREGFSLEDRVLEPYQKLELWLSCKPKDVGLHTSIVHFDAGEDRIERVVFLLADDSISQSLAPKQLHYKARRKPNFTTDDYVSSSRPLRTKTQQKIKCFLDGYPIPKFVRDLVANGKLPKVLKEGLDTENYSSYFSALLILEELHLEKEMEKHSMTSVELRRKGSRFLALDVPGLAEKRPSLVQGDFIFAKVVGGDGTPYQGYIYQVEAEQVLLRFADEFHDQHTYFNLYDIKFTYNRINMRRLYQAIEAAKNVGNDLLFPSRSSRRISDSTAQAVTFFSILNEEQAHAIKSILSCKGSPYVIYGPPGTGKTKTLVEAVLQVYSTREDSRALICAASNSAADHVLERLTSNESARVMDTEIFRLNAITRPYEDVPSEQRRYSYFEEAVFKCPPLKALMRYRIIISTYASSSLLWAEGIERGHFSHIFLDEAGQASEPEAMVPLGNLCQADTVVVLAGDPKQLGPVIHSKDADVLGLGRSYLERLFERDLYKEEMEGFVTKLVRNYRCHKAILDLPSRLFYDGELLACKEEDCDLQQMITGTGLLPNESFPVLFWGIQGCDEREGNNPSWFNRIEVSKVVDVVNKITASGIDEADIGVITPYRQQVVKIRNVLDETCGMSGIKVGSVEQFQGQEREVIIVSTVRSTLKHNELDKAHCLGFLSNPRRFNVAITRAKSLLIIIGNPHIVSKDEYWDKLLRYCSDGNSYMGCQLREKHETTEDEEGKDGHSSVELT